MQALHQRLYHNDKGLNGNQDTEGSSKILLPASKYFTWWENLAAGLLCGYKHRHAYHPASTDRSPRNTHHSHCLPATSPHVTRFRRCKTFEYNSPSLIEDIGKLERNVRRGIDCHSEGRSTVRAAECMLSNEKPETCAPDDRRRLIRTLPPGMISGTVPASVRADEWILSYTALGKPFWFLFRYYPSAPSDYANASTYLKNLTALLKDGKVVPVPHRLMPGGLANVGKEFEEMRARKVRGEKLVYRVGGEAGVDP
ncbi:MAG: hypothetical protein FRX48_04600 [Lasallia pustulata]|uniref:Uncharacterized protein n=1 Tax=Lasallia pustulata TaxID=136370 RepID=A0A5M8PPA3_9LECA|nr:MAG: hypothetical protein FRX48_04600 [Lasallia pustulata]